MSIRPAVILSLLVGALISFPHTGSCGESGEPKIRFGTIPVLQALPLFVAKDKGLFARENVNVELVPFSTASERDIALTANRIDGNFGDLFAAAILKGNGRDVAVVAVNCNAQTSGRMFAIMVPPGSKCSSLKDLGGVPIAISSGSVNHFVTDSLMSRAGVPEAKITTVESKNIGLRLQMLLSGLHEAATLPEPLVSVAESKGASALGDDRDLPGTQTVLTFSASLLRDRPEIVRAFLRAVDAANILINSEPDSIREVMVKNCQLPETLTGTYSVPRFPRLKAPDRDTIDSAVEWLGKQGILRQRIEYDQLVDARFLP
ncbi:MAG: ABC transporter substrate-binding protein [Desulfomonile sp.]|nr:ABC transporter substrate-binding protein [Desulfomonile sp.]